MSDVPSNNLPIFLQQQMLTACEKNDTRMVDHLLSHPNINVNIRNFEELTPLMMSCRDGYSEITEKLVTASTVDLKCQKSLVYGDTATAAMIAAWNNRPEFLKILANQDHRRNEERGQ